MADRGDTHYHVPTLNLWFLGSSAFFLFTMIWTVVDDWDAEWKNYQREFRDLELEMAQAELLAQEQAGALATEEELQAAVEAAQATLDSKSDELAEAEEAVFVLSEERYTANEAFKKAKSVQGWEAWVTEKDLLKEKAKADHDGDPDEFDSEWIRTTLASYQAETYRLELEFQRKDAEWVAATEVVTALKAEMAEAEKQFAAGTRELDRIRTRIDDLDPASFDKKAAGVVRDFPGLDFIGPNLKVNKYVMEHITLDLNFTRKPRIDMCTTCHMGFDRVGFEDAPQPYTTHPRLDLFLTSKSPHPVKDVGCTSCHRGSGESLSFQHTDHRPSDKAEEKAWYEKYHAKKQKYWDWPMLKDKHTEAGCVQCHKTSMDLISDDAQKVFKGYELFESKGCYACHKVDWFPTDRKPGPSLKNMGSKLTGDFVYSWIEAPRDFRPNTHMPQVFHLENFDSEEIVVVSNWGEGEAIKGKEWNENAVASVTAFLFDHHPTQELPPIPADLEGDAERGREVMNVTSCFACHNTAPYDENDDGPPLLSNHVTGHGRGIGKNQMGPDLRGIATKVNKEWLYHWLIDPKAYWPGTRMPDPRLDEQDALDVATYIMEDPDGIFMDTPEDWSTEANWRDKLDHNVLKEQARWFFQKDGRDALEEKIAEGGDWEDKNVLAAKVGEAFVTNQGCFSCHMIDGMENFMPIGTELSTWGSKTVDKLDFGQNYLQDISLPAAFAAHNGIEERTLPALNYKYREGWLERKIAHPRIYDLDKFKTPKDKLRMPWFDLQEDEIDAIATFVLGLVNDDVGQSAMFPTAEQESIDMGRRAVRQNNCASCHQFDPPSVTFKTEDGGTHTVYGELSAVLEEVMPPPMTSMEELADYVQVAEDYAEEELDEYIVRLLDVDPEFGLPNEKIFIPRDDLVGVTSGDGEFIRAIMEYYMVGTSSLPNDDYDPNDPESGPEYYPATVGWDDDQGVNLIEDVDGVQRPYPNEQYDKVRWTFAPPVLWDEGHKLQTDWFYGFLKDPTTLRAQIRVKMPKFHYDEGEAEAIADYFAAKARWERHARYLKTMRVALGRTFNVTDEHDWNEGRVTRDWPMLGVTTGHGVMSIEEMAAMFVENGISMDASTLAAIEDGSKVDTQANWHKVTAFADAIGFTMAGGIKVGHEMVERRTPTYMAAHAGLGEIGRDVAVDGVNCYQCHPNPDAPYQGLDPIAWAPPLENVRSRLREDWVREWLWSPGRKYPGTAMPDNFAAGKPQYQEQYGGSSNEEQIKAVMYWLYNMDRMVGPK